MLFLFLPKIENFVVPENIHTLTTEGIGNSRGVGGSSPRKFQRGWGVRGKIFVQRVGNRSTFFVYQLVPLTYFKAVLFFERFKRLKTSHSLELFAKPFWGLNIGLAIKTPKKFRSRKKKKAGLAVSQSFA